LQAVSAQHLGGQKKSFSTEGASQKIFRIVRNAALVKQNDQLFLESDLPVMFFLIQNVVSYPLNHVGADGKCAESSLPTKQPGFSRSPILWSPLSG
jgi:hypothetical protein